MKYKLFISFIFIANICDAQSDGTMKEIQEFWKNFERIEDLLVALTPGERTDLIYEGIEEQFEGLYVECSSERLENDQFHLIISANGNQQYFSLVKQLVEAQPKLKHFNVTGFRQANSGYDGIDYGGLKLRVNEMYFIPLELEDGLGMEFYVPDENKKFDYETIHNYGSIVIDNLIGEIEFATKIIAYDFYRIEQAKSKSDLIPLDSLGHFLSKNK